MRTVFFGTPEIAVPALEALAIATTVVGVVCQPDRPAGRGLKLRAPAVKEAALSLGLEVHQPVKVKTGTLDEWIREREVDAAIVLAYGRILPGEVLRAPRLGCINLHASILPKFRGAAPIQWAIILGETETGISVMQMDEGMDTGPVFCTRRIPIGKTEDAGALTARLADLAAVMVRLDLPDILSEKFRAEPQDDAAATSAPPIHGDGTRIDWKGSAKSIVNLVRGLSPRPCAQSTLRGKRIKIHVAIQGGALAGGATPGTIVAAEPRGTTIAVADDRTVDVLRAQVEGRKALDAADLFNGRVFRTGDALGT